MTKNENEADNFCPHLITGEDFKKHFELLADLRTFTQIFQEEKNARAAAIVGGAFLDTLLEHILINFLADDSSEVQRLLAPEQPLGTYGSRVRMVYCLGLIDKIVRHDLQTVGKIRNRFAHDLNASFDDQKIRDWTLALKWHEYSMMMKAPEGATAGDVFQVGVNQLICYLHGIVSLARAEKRKIRRSM